MARNEFLLNPLCEEVVDFVALYEEAPEKRVVSLTLDHCGHDLDFQPEAQVTIRPYPLPTAQKLSAADARLLKESINRTRYPEK